MDAYELDEHFRLSENGAGGLKVNVLRVRKPVPAYLLLLVSLLGAVGFGRYHLFLHLREIAALCAVVLFCWLVCTTRIRKNGILPMLVPTLVPGFLAVLFACVFYARTGYSLLPSVLAQRDFIFFLTAPTIYLLHMRGWRLGDFRRAFVLAAVLAVAYYVASYFTVDAQSWLNSGDPYLESLVVYDESRGYRLKGPLFIVLFLALYCGVRTLQATSGTLASVLYFASAALSTGLLVVNLPRSLLFSTVVALILYVVFLRRPARIGLFAVLLPALACLSVVVVRPLTGAFRARFGQDWSYTARVETSERAWDYFLEHPVFGFGQDSKQTVPFQDLFGHQFFPQDIGLLGVGFKFGLVGIFLYGLLATWLLVGLLRMVWTPNATEAAEGGFVWALVITCLGIVVAAPLQAVFIYGEGIPIAALAWGLLLVEKYGSQDRPPATQLSGSGGTRPAASADPERLRLS